MMAKYHSRESYENLYRSMSREFGSDGSEAVAMTNQELIASINSALRFLKCIPFTVSEVNQIIIMLNRNKHE